MWALLESLAAQSFGLQSFIDIGASDGQWTQYARRHFPTCPSLLIEAQPVHEPALRAYCAETPNTHYVLAAAGPTPGEIYFHADGPFSGQAGRAPYEKNNVVVPVTTVDAEVERLKLPGPYLLKLDTHGFEVPILQGATRTLENTAVIIMECYNFRIGAECLLFGEMCVHMQNLGYRCYDLADLTRRPRDNVFWQLDIAFVKDDPAIFNYLGYN
jgi:FkbM family methyltransferase